MSLHRPIILDFPETSKKNMSTTKKKKMSQGLTSLQGGSNKVFIQRDYSEGTSVKFHTRLPSELEGLIERQVFESTINRLNEFFAEAEKGSCSTYCEGCIGCITAYLVYMCSETHYEKTLRKISKFISSQNERIYNPKGLQVIDPTYRGLRVIEISVLDRPGRT
ncbi:golgin subfamily A member 7 [Bactrocera oleae]|uniref:golgin subfamily A member 7 n=1 Tax=Bactrocera oleae TaxID=104688 RepID=UPI00387E50FB